MASKKTASKKTASKKTATKKRPPETFTATVMHGVEGPALYLNGRRIAGPKPWGGGKTLLTFGGRTEDVEEALKEAVDA